MAFIDSALKRAASSVLVVTMLAACGACSGTTEPREAADVSGAWSGRVNWAHTLEMTLAPSASGVVTGNGIRRMIAPNPSRPGALDTVASAMRIEGSLRSGRAELEIINVDLSNFGSFSVVDYRFKGTVQSNTMTGTLSIVQGLELDFGPPYSPTPPENIPFTWVRAPD